MTASHESDDKTLFGFWVYLLTDFMLFATLFAAYVVLRGGTAAGPSGRDLFDLPFILIQTILLLASSFTSGLASTSGRCLNIKKTTAFFGLTFLLGTAFMWMGLADCARLLREGSSWQTSAFLSMYFTLIGTHGLHMVFALLWVPVLLIPALRYGLTSLNVKRLTCLTMFWQFLNIVWIFIFSIVYLLGS